MNEPPPLPPKRPAPPPAPPKRPQPVTRAAVPLPAARRPFRLVPLVASVAAVVGGYLAIDWMSDRAKTAKKVFADATPSCTFILVKKRVEVRPTVRRRSEEKDKLEEFIGSGALIDKVNRIVLTNHHVVEGIDGDAVVFFPEYEAGAKSPITTPSYYAQRRNELGIVGAVIASDAHFDLALVRLDRLHPDKEPLALARESFQAGDDCFSIGNSSLGAFVPQARADSGQLWRTTTGRIRSAPAEATIRYPNQVVETWVVETDAPINPGDSGGAVLNDRGHLAAVVSGFDQNARGVSKYIDLRAVKEFLGKAYERNHLTPGYTTVASSTGQLTGAVEYARNSFRSSNAQSAPTVPPEPTIDDLIRQLGDSTPGQRVAAASKLGRLGDAARKAVPALLKLFADPDADVARAANDALKRVGPPEANADGLAALKDAVAGDHRKSRLYAAGAAEKLGPDARPIYPTLLGALPKMDKEEKDAAVKALDALQYPPLTDLSNLRQFARGELALARLYALLAIAQLGSDARDAIPEVLVGMSHSDEKVRKAAEAAAKAFGRLKATDLPALKEAFRENDAEVHIDALNNLFDKFPHDPQLILELADTLLRDRDSRVRLKMVQALGSFGGDVAAARLKLIVRLTDPVADVRRATLDALKKLGRPNDAELAALVAAVGGTRELTEAAEYAEWVWGETRPATGFPAELIRPLLTEKATCVPAADRLFRVGREGEKFFDPAFDAYEAIPLPDAKATCLKFLNSFGEDKVAKLRDLRRREADRWARSLREAKTTGDRKAVLAKAERLEPAKDVLDALIAALADPNNEVCAAAAKVLAGFGEAAAPAVPALDRDALNVSRLSKDGTVETWLAAVDALRAVGPQTAPALPKLIACLTEGNKQALVDAAIHALAAIGPGAVTRLVNVVCDPAHTPQRRSGALDALALIGPAPATARVALEDLSKDLKSQPTKVFPATRPTELANYCTVAAWNKAWPQLKSDFAKKVDQTLRKIGGPTSELKTR